MMNRIFSILLLFILFFACSKKRNDGFPTIETKGPETSISLGKLHLLLGAVYKIQDEYQDFVMYPDSSIKPEHQRYVTDNGDSIVLSEFNYFIHDLVLFKSESDSVSLKDSVFVVKNTSKKRDDLFYLTSIPEGNYIKASFYLGSLNNQTQLKSLRSKAPWLFSGIDQYDFFQFKGLYKNKDTALAYPNEPTRIWKTFNWSISSTSNSKDQFKQKINCPLYSPITVKNYSSAPYLHIRVNMKAIFGYADQPSSLIEIKENTIEKFTFQNSIFNKNIFSNDNKGANRMFINDHIHPN